jgi:hypothetical protein
MARIGKRINRKPSSSLSRAVSPARGPVWPSLPPFFLSCCGLARRGPAALLPLALGRSAGAAQSGAQPSPAPLPALGRLAAHSARPSRLCAWARRARPAGAGGRFLAAASARGTRLEAVENRLLFIPSNPAASVFLSPRAARPSCLAPVQDRRRNDRRGELVPVFPLPFPFFPSLLPRRARRVLTPVRGLDFSRRARHGAMARGPPVVDPAFAPLALRPARRAHGARPLRVRPPALGHGGAAPARSPPLPRVRMAGVPASGPRFARRGVPAAAPARRCARPWRLARPWSARPQPCVQLGVAAQLACPQLGVAA